MLQNESWEAAGEVAILTSATPSPAQTSIVKKGFVVFSPMYNQKPETISERGARSLIWLKFLMGLDSLLPARPLPKQCHQMETNVQNLSADSSHANEDPGGRDSHCPLVALYPML